jgi:hypothetical protein
MMTDLYFWLGADGELYEQTEESFSARVEDLAERQYRWENPGLFDTEDDDDELEGNEDDGSNL